MTVLDMIRCSGIIGYAIVLASVVLLSLGIKALLTAKTRRAVLPLFLYALAPVCLGLLGTYLGNREIDRKIAMVRSTDGRDVNQADVERGRSLAMITTWMGLIAAAAPVVLGLVGIAIKPGELEGAGATRGASVMDDFGTGPGGP
ncbi:MAG: hypothetical protein ACYSU0_14645 [Planctomycetota bacterium]|jgi:hypothetical protein